MKKLFTQTLLLLAFALTATVAFAQPSNDQPCGAIAVILNDPPITYNNSTATGDANEVGPTANDCITGWCELSVDSTMWYTFIAPASGAVTANTCITGVGFDTQLAIYSATDCADYSTFTLMGANDDTPGGCTGSGSNWASTLDIDALIPGNTYYLQVDGYFGQTGDFQLEVLASTPKASVKWVNNCADALGATVDIRVNGELVVDNLAFRSHTNFIDVTANEAVTITVNDMNSVDDSAPLYSVVMTLDAAKNYIAVGNGILSSTGYSPAVPFAFSMFDNAALNNVTTDSFATLLLHGSTDAPSTVDVEDFNTGTTLFNDLAYGQFYGTDYTLLPAGLYSLDLADASGNNLGLTYCANLEFAPANIIVIASGFVNPANNSGGPGFGLFTFNNNFGGAFTPLMAGACIAPANDQPCNATTLVVNDFPTAGSNMFATAEEDEAHPPGTACQDSIGWCAFDSSATISVWYKFIAPVGGTVTVTTCLPGTSLDSQVAVYTVGNCSDYSTYTLLGANDDAIGGCTGANTTFASILTLNGLTPGNNYYVQVDGYGGSDNPFNIQVTAPVGVNEIANKRAFSVYPNPAKEVLTVKYAGSAPVQVYDSRGALVLTQRVTGQATLDISNLSDGVYTMSVMESDQVQTLRFVVE